MSIQGIIQDFKNRQEIENDIVVAEETDLQIIKDIQTQYSDKLKKLGKGIIGIASHYLGRYREFDICLTDLISPPDTMRVHHLGVNIALHYNNTLRDMLHGDYEWCWILNDDHVFAPDLLINLLERNVDVIVPLCLQRVAPFKPILHGCEANKFKKFDFPWFKNQRGLVDISDKSIGTAGMLIRRRVAEGMQDPWFENGKTHPEVNGMDLWFCEKLRSTPFKLYMDTENTIGHMTHMAVWPSFDEEGNMKSHITHGTNLR